MSTETPDVLTLTGSLASTVARDPGAPVLHEPTPHGYSTLTRADFSRLVAGWTRSLEDAGVGSGDCIAVWLPNWSSAIALQFAASSLGAHVVGVNTRYNANEVGHVLAKATPKILVVAHAFRRLDLMSRARTAMSQVDVAPPVVMPVAPPGTAVANTPVDPVIYDLGAGVVVPDGSAEAGAKLLVPHRPADVVVAFTTSGSTGLPKVAGHSERGVVLHSQAVAASACLDTSSVLIAPLPFSGVFGYNPIIATLLAGGQIVLHPAFDADILLREMDRFSVTHFVGADDMLVRLREAWDRSPVELSSWKFLLMADFLGRTGEIADWVGKEFGTSAQGVYGSSEVYALLAHWRPNTGSPRQWVGGGVLVSSDYEYRLVDEEGTPGVEEGELQLRTPTTTDVYLGDAGEGSSAYTDDGWFRSGDLCRAVDDRSFEYVCRAGDVLRLKGFLVEPAEIETRLLEHPSVEVAKVVGTTTDAGEPLAVGFVTLREEQEVTGEELVAWCATNLARFKVPTRVQVLEEMPTTVGTNGAKIKAAELRRMAAALV